MKNVAIICGGDSGEFEISVNSAHVVKKNLNPEKYLSYILVVSKNDTLLPFSDARCGRCDVTRDGFVPVKKLEEKRSDVNIAVAMLLDAVRTDTESFVLITGDSDQVGAIEALRYELGESVLVFNPHAGLSQHLKRAASYYKNIPRDLPARCQLPDEIPVGTHGNVIRRPEAWR